DTDGEPVEHLPVQLLASQIVQGRRTWMQRGFATTDEDGSYTLPSLQAGRYLVRTLNHPVSAAASNAPAQVYAARYYPGTPDLSSAQVIQVTAGQDVTIDISLRPENAFRVTGSLVGMPQGGGSAFVLNDADGQPASFEGTTIDQSTGKFTIEHVPSGSWTIALRVSNMHGSTYSVRQDFTVTGNDVGGLQVLPQPAADIPVTLNPASGAGAQIHLVPAQSTARENYFAQRSSQSSLPTDRSLFIAGVPPGSYRLVVDVFGPQCVESASSGSTDLTRDDLIVSAGSQPELILVTLGNRCATLTGRTSPSDVQGVNAFIVAAQQTAQGAAKFAPFVTGQSSTLAGLSPGTYMIYAFSNLDDLEYANPDALREYHGQQLNLQAGQQANVTVDVNQREHK
ncbi:MAG TPA: carboxypeptidase-like regulatory domain-containing protein, partial [Bryobacteraceae bacterium]|nr:carboxypeptidase-like regulatory domain-containing protein [Bryobacteraceae bacterium]